MLREFSSRFTLLAVLLCAPYAFSDPAPAVRLPPGTRQVPEGHYVSGRGLRDSTDFIAKQLAKSGIAVEQIGPYRVKGVEVTRFVSTTSTTPWLAIHILRTAGKTLIFFVDRPKA
jgi:hypothetical protein